MNKKKNKRELLEYKDFSKINLAAFALIFALIGGYIIYRSFADTGSTQPIDTAGALEVPYNNSDWFSSTAIWKQPIPTNAQVIAGSSSMVDVLLSQIGVNPDGSWINPPYGQPLGLRWFGYEPLYVVPAGQPLKNVCSYAVVHHQSWSWMNDLDKAFMQGIPLPSDFVQGTGGGSDEAATIYQPSSNTEWDLYQIRQPATDGSESTDPLTSKSCDYIASGGGRIQNLGAINGLANNLASPGYFRNNPPNEETLWGRRASALPTAAGIIQPEEWNDPLNQLHHTIQLVVPWAGPGMYWPAARSDGTHTGAPPEGARLRIDPSYNCYPDVTTSSSLYAQRVAAFCHVLQDYGGVITDQSGNGIYPVFRTSSRYTKDAPPTDNNGNRWPNEYWDNLITNGALTHLEVLDPASYENITQTISGDINGDGHVNVFDLSILLSNYGSTAANCDLNNDGTVNIFDLSILLSHYGT